MNHLERTVGDVLSQIARLNVALAGGKPVAEEAMEQLGAVDFKRISGTWTLTDLDPQYNIEERVFYVHIMFDARAATAPAWLNDGQWSFIFGIHADRFDVPFGEFFKDKVNTYLEEEMEYLRQFPTRQAWESTAASPMIHDDIMIGG